MKVTTVNMANPPRAAHNATLEVENEAEQK